MKTTTFAALFAVLSLLCVSAVSPAAMIGHWTLDDPAGSPTVADSSGNGYDGTVYSGATLGVAGKLGTAVSGDGINDVITADLGSDAVTGSGVRTITAWFNITDWNSAQTGIIGVPSGTSWGRFDFNAELVGSTPAIRFRYQGGNHAWTGTAEIGGFSAGTWYNLAVVVPFDGAGFDDVQLYVNGVELTSDDGTAKTNEIATNLTILTIGHSADELAGLVDDVSYWNEALSASDIQAIYQGGLAGKDVQAVMTPEPATMALLAFGGLVVIRRRRR